MSMHKSCLSAGVYLTCSSAIHNFLMLHITECDTCKMAAVMNFLGKEREICLSKLLHMEKTLAMKFLAL
jgi:hypothetical protein